MRGGRDPWTGEALGSPPVLSDWPDLESKILQDKEEKCSLSQSLFQSDSRAYRGRLNETPKAITVLYFSFGLFLIP